MDQQHEHAEEIQKYTINKRRKKTVRKTMDKNAKRPFNALFYKLLFSIRLKLM